MTTNLIVSFYDHLSNIFPRPYTNAFSMTEGNSRDKSIAMKLKTWQRKVGQPVMDNKDDTFWRVADKELNEICVYMEYDGIRGNISFCKKLTWAVNNDVKSFYVITSIWLCC